MQIGDQSSETDGDALRGDEAPGTFLPGIAISFFDDAPVFTQRPTSAFCSRFVSRFPFHIRVFLFVTLL